jgi:hypothetical protein
MKLLQTGKENMQMNSYKPILVTTLALLLLFAIGLAADTTKALSAEQATGEQIKWQVISSGGSDAASGNLWLRGTVGQTAVGVASSGSFNLSHGFWYATCCNHDGIRGDENSDNALNVADVTYLTAYLKQKPPGSPEPPCFEEGDVNGSGSINVADVTYLSAYFKQKPPGSPAPPACP